MLRKANIWIKNRDFRDDSGRYQRNPISDLIALVHRSERVRFEHADVLGARCRKTYVNFIPCYLRNSMG